MAQLKPLYVFHLFSTLSIDVVIGAVIGAGFVSRILGVHPGGWFYLILALSVWIMYTADHLVDARRLKGKAHTERHLFHHRNFKLLISIVIGLGILDFILVLLKFPSRIIFSGFIILIFTAIYFGVLTLLKSKRSLLLQKEFIIAFVYTSGIWIGPLALRNFILQNNEMFLLIIFFVLAWAVVLFYSVMEEKEDRLDKHHTFATNFGLYISSRLIHAFVLVVFVLSSYLITISGIELERQAAKLFLLMAFLIAIMNAYPDFFKTNYRYRYIGELIFWIPILLII